MIQHIYIRHFLLTAAMVLSTILCRAYAAGTEGEPFRVVIDAGHGGRDLGCQGKKGREKEITLAVAQKVAKLLRDKLNDSVSVTLTRKNDVFVALDKRAAIANDADADAFVSIHVNSIDRRSKGRASVHGASVYTVGLHKSEANLAVAMRENSVIELEPDFSATYQDFDPDSSESYIIFELGQNRNMEQSVELASLIQQRLVGDAGRADKGVRQAGFLVLWATRMPSVLVELDFICNPSAERFLVSDQGQEQCARAIADALFVYRNRRVPAISVK